MKNSGNRLRGAEKTEVDQFATQNKSGNRDRKIISDSETI